MLYRLDAYLREATATVLEITEQGGIVPDRSVFYPTGGGQPGDSGKVYWDGGECSVATTVKGEGDHVVFVPSDAQPLPAVGTKIRMELDWQRRYSLMRVHSALHLLSVAIPFGVTGGSISEGRGRLDFDMAEPPSDKDAITQELNRMIATDAAISESWITDEELDAKPELVKTMSVKPPRGSGRIRLIRIGTESDQIDLQPCGGTHVARLSEIGTVRLGKVEKKGRMNRRVYLHLND